MRIDQPDEDDGQADNADTPDSNEPPDTTAVASFRDSTDSGDALDPDHLAGADREPKGRAAECEEYYTRVDAVYRAHAIDQAYERVREIECGIVTPAMRRIEAEDPGRHLAGLENSLKGKDRLTQKIYEQIRSLPDDDAEVDRLHAYQREVTAKIPTPPGAPGIPDYP